MFVNSTEDYERILVSLEFPKPKPSLRIFQSVRHRNLGVSTVT